MLDLFPPFLPFILGALALPLIPSAYLRNLVTVIVPVIAGCMIWALPYGMHNQIMLGDAELTLLRVDKLSVVFGLIFAIAAFLSMIYAWHVRDLSQQIGALLYAGSAIGAVFAGDFISLFVFWEGTAIASVFLIWARRTNGAYHTGMRYLIVQVGSGVILLAGIAVFFAETGSVAFDAMVLGSLATWLILIAFGIKCAFPLLHNWLHDAYPAATITGTVILSAFTTKLAVYALARGFAGTEILIYIGAVMAIFPVFYGLVENDLRRVLSYAINNQLGFMVIGVGIGTELALNGTAAQAFAHILYKALLFMGIGAVMFRTGTSKASELGGLYKFMPLTMLFCLVGAASISFPLFSGFVTKSLILSAAGKAHYDVIWGILIFASIGVFFMTGIKVPYYAFFGKASAHQPAEAPRHMLWAMGVAAALCVLIGLFPQSLYALLPYDVKYDAYTTTHVVTQMQMIFFTGFAFALALKFGLMPKLEKSTMLEFDWVYRKALPVLVAIVSKIVKRLWNIILFALNWKLARLIAILYHSHGPEGRMARTWPTGSMVLWVAIILTATLIANFVA